MSVPPYEEPEPTPAPAGIWLHVGPRERGSSSSPVTDKKDGGPREPAAAGAPARSSTQTVKRAQEEGTGVAARHSELGIIPLGRAHCAIALVLPIPRKERLFRCYEN
jgi:hypothetical protein